ncbi:MAG: hypothetical protein DMF89_15060 [Acidobacteria bacterium]|nr:MAG: hypothetical protein DMF90_22100 [Acidobacteriota bacterium]PYR48607.1 MAG: hypothetical protein DMF89_15060 [Acidobacteriota bacterium]
MEISDAVRLLDRELGEVFGSRLQSFIAYAHASTNRNRPSSTLAILASLTTDDLRACAGRARSWHEAGAETPLLLESQEFARSLDAFPFEFGGILANHVIVSGIDPFVGLVVDPEDLRRACEVRARSHLLHLREGYIETHGRSDAVADLIQRSAGPLAALLTSVGRLTGTAVGDATLTRVTELHDGRPIAPAEARSLFPAYLEAVVSLTKYVDRWNSR